MFWLKRLFQAGGPTLAPDLSDSLRWWRGLPRPDLRVPWQDQRWVVLDVETTGLDLKRDRLISIGAIAMHGSAICLEDSFEVVLRQNASSQTENILVHGITGREQLDGADPAACLAAFLRYVNKDPLLAFNAIFDKTFIESALHQYLGVALDARWIDVAELALALMPGAKESTLDSWLERYDIFIAERHRASADALATAQFFAILQSVAMRQGVRSAKEMLRLSHTSRWLGSSTRK